MFRAGDNLHGSEGYCADSRANRGEKWSKFSSLSSSASEVQLQINIQSLLGLKMKNQLCSSVMRLYQLLRYQGQGHHTEQCLRSNLYCPTWSHCSWTNLPNPSTPFAKSKHVLRKPEARLNEFPIQLTIRGFLKAFVRYFDPAFQTHFFKYPFWRTMSCVAEYQAVEYVLRRVI